MEWKTRVTELLGCQYPILQGAFGGFGNWQFAATVAEAGGHGTITAAVSRTPARLREDIKRCRGATDGSFGVNLSLGGSLKNPEEMLEVCLEEGVLVETAAYKPDALAPRIKEGGVKWIHKAARVKDAVHAEHLGVDAVIVVGLEGAGHKSPEQLPTMLTTIWAKRELTVPFIAAGGIADARGFLGALAMGADGIMMGTAFMATKECPLKDAVKEAMVQTPPGDPQLRQRVLASADPEAYAEVMKLRGTMPDGEWLRKLQSVRTGGAGSTSPMSEGSSTRGTPGGGSLAMAFIDYVPTVKEFIDSIIHGAEELLDSYQFLKMR